MIRLTPLLAVDISQVIGVIVVILFIIVPAIGQLLAKMGQQQRPGGGRPPGRPPAGGGPAAGRPAAGGLEDEIGEFLRRAAQRRQAQAAPPPPPRGHPVGPPAMAQPVRPQLVQAEVVRPQALGEGIKQHVGEYLDPGEFQRRAAGLGEEVAQADEQIEQRLHARFNHQVSSLADTPGESAAVPRVAPAGEPEDRVGELPSTAAAGLAAMLGSSEGIRRAIVINEILTRPEDRWT
jgi:hypothetical protein